MNIIETLIYTQKGWIIRQALKWIVLGAGSATTWLVAKGVAIDNPEAITGAATTIGVGLIEFALSKAASKIAAK